MAVILLKEEANYTLLVYKIEEGDNFYHSGIDFTEHDIQEYENISNPLKKRQWLASRYWLKKISKQKRTLYIQKSELGKPHITNHQAYFSISHSKDTIAIIYSLENEVAVDIEFIQNKIAKIKNKFLHPLEFKFEDNLQSLAIIWSAKESIYKYYHSRSLYSFKENIIVQSIEPSKVQYTLSNPSIQRSHSVFHLKIEEFIVTWISN